MQYPATHVFNIEIFATEDHTINHHLKQAIAMKQVKVLMTEPGWETQ